MDPSTVSVYDDASRQFATEWREQPPPHDMYALLLQHFRPGATVDIGCGAGRDVAWLLANGFEASGYDASEGLLREARAACPGAHFGLARLPDLLGVPRRAYTNVLCETVIMHLAPPEIPGAVRNLVSLLRPGGTMWLSWRVTADASRRDDAGRLYTAFDKRIVLEALGDVEVLLDREEPSGSSGKVVSRLIVRTAVGRDEAGRARPSRAVD